MNENTQPTEIIAEHNNENSIPQKGEVSNTGNKILPNQSITKKNDDDIKINENDINNDKDKTIKNYSIIYTLFFKYGILILIVILAIIIFVILIKKDKQISTADNNIGKTVNINKLNNDIKDIEDIESTYNNIKIHIKQGELELSDNIILSYNNLISFNGFTMPRGFFLYEPNSLENIGYFNNPNYDIEKLYKVINNIIFIDYDEIKLKENKELNLLNLKDNSIEKTFFLSCINRPQIFNVICNKYIKEFLSSFFVYDLKNDLKNLSNILKKIITKNKYKIETCNGIQKYMITSKSAPNELEDIAILCGGDTLTEFYKIQDFTKVENELENKYITSNISKRKDINEYKLVSYQQILYNNIEKGVTPYESMYKNYTSFIANLLKKLNEESINPFYLDETYRFNNSYIIPSLNKLKYQSTSTKREEIESIITELEKINNGSSIDGFIGLKHTLINPSLIEEINKNRGNINIERDDIMSTLLKNIKLLSYLKVINDEIDGNQIKINGYLSINIKGNINSIFFGSILENKNGNLILKEINLNGYDELNKMLKIIINQKDYNIGEIYEYIQNNIGLYISENLNLSPCNIISERLKKLNIEGLEILYCDENKINIIKGSTGNKVFYQITMDKYDVKSASSTDKNTQEYINENLIGINTNSITISNWLENIITYKPKVETGSTLLEGNNYAITTIDDFQKYLGTNIVDIGERNGKAAAEFSINNINFIGIYDINSKKLGPIYLKKDGADKEEIIFRNFKLYLTPENQNEINRFLIETIDYLREIDPILINKFFNEDK